MTDAETSQLLASRTPHPDPDPAGTARDGAKAAQAPTSQPSTPPPEPAKPAGPSVKEMAEADPSLAGFKHAMGVPIDELYESAARSIASAILYPPAKPPGAFWQAVTWDLHLTASSLIIFSCLAIAEFWTAQAPHFLKLAALATTYLIGNSAGQAKKDAAATP